MHDHSTLESFGNGKSSESSWIYPICIVLSRRGGGGGGYCMHIGYVPRARPPFSALNFRSGEYHFHKLPYPPKKKRSGASPFYFFLADFAVPETIILQISLISTRSSAQPLRSAAPRVSGRPEHQSDASWQFRRLAFSRSKPVSSSARSPHYHAQNGSSSIRSPAFSRSTGSSFRSPGPFFTLPRHIPTRKFGMSTPPPPPGVLCFVLICILWKAS